MPKKQIAIIATLDTKLDEALFISSLIKKGGYLPVLIDVGPLTAPSVHAQYSNKAVAKLAGHELSRLIKTGPRDRIMTTMGQGASKALIKLLKGKRLAGVMGIGGNQGSAMASIAMKTLPIGFPKVLVSTVASGNIRPYIGHKDIMMVFSVADLVGGLNPVSRSVLSNATAALLGMIKQGVGVSLKKGEKHIAITALGNTEAAASRITGLLQEKGFQAMTFHASGAGGTAMEELMEEGVFKGVIDLTPHELAEEVVGLGAYVPVRPGRLLTAGKLGIPQVVSTGAMEYLCFGPRESIPIQLRRRRMYFHNPLNANVKASRAEMCEMGKTMAERLGKAKGPVEILIPTKGWSIYGSKGGPLYDSVGNAGLVKALKKHLKPRITLREIDANINDPQFADECVDCLARVLRKEKK